MRLRGFLAPVASAIVLAGVGAAPAAAAPGAPGGPTNAQIQAARTKAAQLSGLIAADNEREQIAGERYDQANVLTGLAERQLVALRSEIRRENRAIVAGKRRVQQAAVEAYIDGDSAAAQFAGFFASSFANAESLTTYAGVATAFLHSAVVRLDEEQARLHASEAAARHEVATARATALSSGGGARRGDRRAANDRRGAGRGQGTDRHLHRGASPRPGRGGGRGGTGREGRQGPQPGRRECPRRTPPWPASSPGAIPRRRRRWRPRRRSRARSATRPSSRRDPSAAGNLAVQTAEQYLGVPYVWGGAGPLAFDCSGLTMVAWAAAGVSLTHSAWYQYRESQLIPLSALEPGDLLFYSFPNDGPDPVTHVAMYVGAGPYGTETIIQAPETGETVSYSPMYYFGFVAAGRP